MGIIKCETFIDVQFYDVDSMDVVWHGNYAKFLEQGRCDLLNLVDYGYKRMKESGYAWPLVKMNIKYIRPCLFMQKIIVASRLTEYINRICVKYDILDAASRELLSKAETVQMAVNMNTMETCFTSPDLFINKVEAYLDA